MARIGSADTAYGSDNQTKRSVWDDFVFPAVMGILVSALLIAGLVYYYSVREETYDCAVQTVCDMTSRATVGFEELMTYCGDVNSLFVGMTESEADGSASIDAFLSAAEGVFSENGCTPLLIDSKGNYYGAAASGSFLNQAVLSEKDYGTQYFVGANEGQKLNRDAYLLGHFFAVRRLRSPITVPHGEDTVTLTHCATMFEMSRVERVLSLAPTAEYDYFLTDKDGYVLYRSEKLGLVRDTAGNAIDPLRGFTYPHGEIAEDVKTAVLAGKEPVGAELEKNKVHYYYAASPIASDTLNWKAVYILPTASVPAISRSVVFGGVLEGLLVLSMAAFVTCILLVLRRQRNISAALTEQKRLNAVLSKAKESADNRTQAKTAFLSNVGRDIRTPIDGIMGVTRDAMREEMSETLRDSFGKIDDASKLLFWQINALLAMSGIESGQTKIVREPMDICAAAKGCTDEIAGYVDRYGIRVTTRLETPHRFVFGDETHLRLLLLNLLACMAHFMPNGGELACTLEEQPTQNAGVYKYRFAIRDTVGELSEKTLAQLTRMIDGENGDDRDEAHGAEIGLTLARKLVGLMNGELTVGSAAGQGTTFNVTLPLVTDDTP